MDEEATQFTIGELADRADVTPRTVRFYVTEGLLPAPAGAGQHRLYTWEHLLRLQLIKRLKAQYLPLGEIRGRLDGLSVAELEQLLRATPEAPPAPSSALDYIAGVLQAPAAATRLPRPAPPAPAWSPPAPEATRLAPPFAPAAPTPAPAPRFGPEPSARPPYQPPAPAAPAAPAAAPAPEPPVAGATSRSPAGIWRRILLAPGVELHYQPSSDAGWEARVARLIRAASRLLGGAESE